MPEARGLRRWLERRWYEGSAPPWLRPLAMLHGSLLRWRRHAHARGWLASHHPGVPVIVVGNLTVGGTGKTPLVLWLAEALLRAGRRPGIVLRGYGGRVRAPRLVRAGDTATDVGDEAVLLARRVAVPIAVGADRAAAAKLLAAAGCTLVISDDGLQHLALRRDLSIIVIDGLRGFGNGSLLPAGPLREPVTALRDADLVVVHGERGMHDAGTPATLCMALQPGDLRALRTAHAATLATLRGTTVHAVAGIGNPRRFFELLRAHGAHVVEHAFADHHAYVAADLAFGDELRIVMTEKDAVKCAAFADARMWYLPVSAGLPAADAARLLDAALALAPGDRRHA